MTPRTSALVMLALSVVFGLVIALLAVLDVAAMPTVAVVGALVIGALWALQGLYAAARGRNRGNRPRAG